MLKKRAYESSIDELYFRLNAFSSYMMDSPTTLIEWINETDFDEPLLYYQKAIPHYHVALKKYKQYHNIIENEMDLTDYTTILMDTIAYPSTDDRLFIETLPIDTYQILRNEIAQSIFSYYAAVEYLENVNRGCEKYNWFIIYQYLDYWYLQCTLPEKIVYDINEVIKHNKIVDARKKLLEELIMFVISVIRHLHSHHI